VLDRHEFVVHGGVESPFAAVVSALRSGFIVEVGNPRTVRRTWLDTFDWRLHRAGLTLEHLTCAGSEELSLSPGPRLAVSGRPGAWTWPGRVDGLNAGALGERLGPIAGIRVLLAVAETKGTVRDLRLMNKDQKTVVRVGVEDLSLTPPAAGRLAPRVTVAAVRGYGRQAKRARQLIASVPGIMPTGESTLDAALAAMGRRAGDYTGRLEISLDGSAPAGAAVAAVLLRLLEMLEANVDGVIRDLDTEFLHDLRISVRRTRSGLTLAGDTLPAGLVARFADEFKWLGDLTTPVRDLDVYLLGLDGTTGEQGDGELAPLEPFRRYLARRRHAERRRLLAGLRSTRFSTLTGEWRAALLAASDQSVADGPTTASFAAARISRGYRRIVKRGSAITPASPAQELHRLRKRCKQLRYLMEYFASLHDPTSHRKMIKELKSLQDCLGRFQDSHTQREAISALADEMAAEQAVTPAALLAMGELGAGLKSRQRDARAEFASRFNRFASTKTARIVKALPQQSTS
jgi:CHAD domain-containing protein